MRYIKPLKLRTLVPVEDLERSISANLISIDLDECLSILQAINATRKTKKTSIERLDTFLQKIEYFFSLHGDNSVDVIKSIKRQVDGIKYTIKMGKPKRMQLPIRVKNACLKRDGHACKKCGVSAQLHIDHIIEYCDGGSNALDNLQTLCAPCHFQKSAESRRKRKEIKRLSTGLT